METSVLRDLELAGGIAGMAAVALTVLWLTTMIRVPPPNGAAKERLVFYDDRRWLLWAHFVPSLLIAVAYVPIWIGLAAFLWPAHASLAVLSSAFGLLYVPFALTGYSLQFTAARGIVECASEDRDGWLPVWRVVSFSDAPESASGWLVVLGYALWGAGGAFAAAALLSAPGGLEIAAGCALAVTALLTWLGAAGVAASDRRLQWAVLASGATSLAATGLVAVLLLV
jgi:hypothetical protein